MPARKLVVRGGVRQEDTTAAEDTGGENGTDPAPKVRLFLKLPSHPFSWH